MRRCRVRFPERRSLIYPTYTPGSSHQFPGGFHQSSSGRMYRRRGQNGSRANIVSGQNGTRNWVWTAGIVISALEIRSSHSSAPIWRSSTRFTDRLRPSSSFRTTLKEAWFSCHTPISRRYFGHQLFLPQICGTLDSEIPRGRRWDGQGIAGRFLQEYNFHVLHKAEKPLADNFLSYEELSLSKLAMSSSTQGTSVRLRESEGWTVAVGPQQAERFL
jgi:hypothetical protein